jgi:prepilin peptidase CpaA
MGAGDVKLMAAVGSVVGVPAIVGVFILTALFGGVLSIVALQQREKPTKPRPRLLTLGTAANGSVKIPYGVAISFSVLTVAGLRIF